MKITNNSRLIDRIMNFAFHITHEINNIYEIFQNILKFITAKIHKY